MNVLDFLAQTTTAPTTQPAAPGWLDLIIGNQFLILMVLVIVVLWIFTSRTRKAEEKKKQDMLAQMKRGTRVETIGGILGTVVEAREEDVLVKVDESSNTKIRFSRAAIRRVLGEEDEKK